MAEVIKIILIDKNPELFDKLNSLGCSTIDYIDSIEISLNKIKQIAFQELRIIINGNIYSKFAEKFTKNITDIFTIPKIIIYTESEELFFKENKAITKDAFFKFSQIITSINDLKKFINEGIINQKFEIQKEPNITFQLIDKHQQLALHLFYKVLIQLTDIENNNSIIEKIYNNYQEKSNKIKTLLSPILTMKYIPIELLVKYLMRAYTANCDFYVDVNNNLRNEKNIENDYLTFIKLLYESLKSKAFPLSDEKKLFRGSLLSKEEIEKIRNNFNNNKESELPKVVLFSKTFLSFSKDKQFVLDYFSDKKNDENNLSKVLFILEKKEDNNYDYSIATHADIEKISYFPNEKEVLFFPFSSFKIIGIKQKYENGELIYIINLEYLGLKDVDIIEKYIQGKKEKSQKKGKKSKKMSREKIKFEQNKKNIEVENGKVKEIEKDIKIEKEEKKMEENEKLMNGGIKEEDKKEGEKEEEKKNEEEKKEDKKEEEKEEEKKDEEKKEEEKKGEEEEKKDEEKKEDHKEEEKKNEEEKNEDHKEEEKKEEVDKREEKKEDHKEEEKKEEKTEEKNKEIQKEKEEKKIEVNNINNSHEENNEIKTNLEVEKIEDFEFMKQITESGLIKLEDITSVEELFIKYKEYKKKLNKILSKNSNNYIKGKIYINEFYVNKKVKILSSFEQYEGKHYTIKIEDLDLYKNTGDIKRYTKIKINDEEIDFSFYHTFEEKGEYDIEYIFKKPLTKIDYLFSDCNLLTSLDLSNFDTGNVINMCGLFNGCKFLKNLDLTNINTTEVFDMSRMFYNCKSLIKLDLSYFNTKNVIYMRDMFFNCIYIENLNLSNFITNKVQNMSNMFNGCKSLFNLNLTNFNVDRVSVMWKMFHGCVGLKNKSLNNNSLKLLNELKGIKNF